jgi:hypothetical protein
VKEERCRGGREGQAFALYLSSDLSLNLALTTQSQASN